MELHCCRPTSRSAWPPVLFVHGMWHGAWCWEKHFVPYFCRRGFEAWTLGLRGHGGRRLPTALGRVSFQDYLHDLDDAVGAVGTPPILVGHSMGGLLVQRYLEGHRVPAAVLMASIPPGGILGAAWRICNARPATLVEIGRSLSLRPVVATAGRTRRLLFSSATPQATVDECQSRLQDDSLRAFLEMMVMVPAAYRTPPCPMMVMGALADGTITANEVRRTARRYGTEPIMIPETGHDMMLEPTWRQAAGAVTAWLADRLPAGG